MSFSTLIDKLHVLVHKKGPVFAEKWMDQALVADTVEFNDPVAENIASTVCAKFKITVQELVYGKGRRNDRKMAIGFCTLYFMRVRKMKLDAIKDVLNKDESVCRKYMKKVEGLSDRHVSDKPYLHYKNEFDLIFLKSNSQ